MTEMRPLGSEKTVFQQTVTFIGTLFVVGVIFLFFLFYRNWSAFFFFLFTTLLFGLINYFNLKFYEVYFNDEKIYVKNLFTTIDYNRSDFEKIDKTFASPYFFQIIVKRRSFYFFPKITIALNEFIGTSSALVELNKTFEG